VTAADDRRSRLKDELRLRQDCLDLEQALRGGVPDLGAAADRLRDAGYAVLAPAVVSELHNLIARVDELSAPGLGYARVVGALQAHIGVPSEAAYPNQED
jgi:hypothetical protein